MSGHSKWSQIKRQKGVTDQKRGLVFSKLSKIITLAVTEGGGIGNPENNVRLRLAVDRARALNMPKINIERAIERGSKGETDGMKEMVYEGFGHGGVSLIVTAATDNPSRTHSQIKSTLEKYGGKMGNPNSVLYLFDKCGIVVFEKSTADEAQVLTFTDAIGALDIEEGDDSYVVYVPFAIFGRVGEYLSDLTIKMSDMFYRPKSIIMVSKDQELLIQNLIGHIEDLDDVDKVYSNYEVIS